MAAPAPFLYKTVASPPSSAVLMLADLLEVHLDTKDIDFKNKEHKTPEYLKINPMGTFPALKDGDFVISESHSILKYLVCKEGSNWSLYPKDLRTRAIIDQCLFFNTGVFFIKFIDAAGVIGDKKQLTPQMVEDLDGAYGVLEAYLGTRKYLAADHLTIADIALGTTAAFTQLVHKVDTRRFPRTADWISRLERETFFSKFSKPGIEAFRQLKQL